MSSLRYPRGSLQRARRYATAFGQALGCPVGGERPDLVADVEAYVVAFLEHDKVGWPCCCAGETLALAHRNELVASAIDDEQRAFDPLRDAFESQAARDLVRFIQAAGVAPHPESLLRGG